MATKKEILSTFDSKEGAWFAYREGMQVGYNEAYNSLRNQAAIAAMQGIISIQKPKSVWDLTKLANNSVDIADALIEELRKKK